MSAAARARLKLRDRRTRLATVSSAGKHHVSPPQRPRKQRTIKNLYTTALGTLKMPLVGFALGPVHPLDLPRAGRNFAAAGEEGLRDSTNVLDILLLEVVVSRKIEAAVSEALGFFELNIVRLSTLEEVHGLHMKREEIIPRLDLMLPQEVPKVVLLSKALARDTDPM